MAKIDELRKRYKGQWLAIDVTKEKGGRAIEGRLVLHTTDREKLWRSVPVSRKRKLYVTYAGPILDRGYAAAF
jgi:hypothetical protein